MQAGMRACKGWGCGSAYIRALAHWLRTSTGLKPVARTFVKFDGIVSAAARMRKFRVRCVCVLHGLGSDSLCEWPPTPPCFCSSR